MLKINLLPDSAKQIIARDRANSFIWFYGLVFISLSVFSAIILYGFDQYFKIQLKSVDNIISVQQGSSVAKSADDLSKKVKVDNAKLKSIDNFLNGFVSIYDLFNKVSQARVEGVSYNSINMEPNQNRVIINGIANKRNQLQSFKASLEAVDQIKSVDLPLSSVLQPVDINFRIEITLKK